MKFERMKPNVSAILILLAMLVSSTYLQAQEFSDLDDVTMQVIEMEQLPDDVIKLIPLPNHTHKNVPHTRSSEIQNNSEGFYNMQDPNQMPGIPDNIDPLTGMPQDPILVDPLPDGSYGIEPIPMVDPATGANFPSPTDPGMIPPELPPDPVMEPPQLPPIVDNLPPDPGALP